MKKGLITIIMLALLSTLAFAKENSPEMLSAQQIWQETCRIVGKTGQMPKVVLMNPGDGGLYIQAILKKHPGIYRPETNTVFLRRDKHLHAGILAHEFAHSLDCSEEQCKKVDFIITRKIVGF